MNHRGRFWRRARLCFRRLRLVVWLALLALLGALFYLNQVGLPARLKQPLLNKLRAQGLDLEFSRLRLSWTRGLVAQEVSLGRADQAPGLQCTFAEVQVQLNFRALTRRQLQVDGLVLRQGRLLWPLSDPNRPERRLALENIQTELRFLPGDQWALDNFQAALRGASLRFSGAITNASALRNRTFGRGEAGAGAWLERLRRLADALDGTKFTQPPVLTLDLRGDALDRRSFRTRLFADAPALETPWGTVERGRLAVVLSPAAGAGTLSATLDLRAARARSHGTEVTRLQFRASAPSIQSLTNLADGNFTLDLDLRAARARSHGTEVTRLQLRASAPSIQSLTNLADGNLTLEAAGASTPWMAATNVGLTLRFTPAQDDTNLARGDLLVRAERASGPWGSGVNPRLEARWSHALTNLVPLAGQGQLDSERVHTQWGAARQLHFRAHLSQPEQRPPAAGSLRDLALFVAANTGEPPSSPLPSRQPEGRPPRRPGAGGEDAPAPVPPGSARPGSAPEAPSEQPSRRGPPASKPPEGEGGWAWLDSCAWDWDWRLAGLALSNLMADAVSGEGSWQAPALALTNVHLSFASGQMDLGVSLDVASRQFRADIVSDANPRELEPLLPVSARRWLAQFAYDRPPWLAGQVALRLPDWTNRQPDWRSEVQPTLRLEGEFKAPLGGAYRGVAVTRAQSHLAYSNLCWRLPDLELARPEGQVRAEHRANDQTKEFYWRVASTVDARGLLPVLIPQARDALELFTFSQPPRVEAEVWGQYDDPSRTGLKGWVELTNFSFRGETLSAVQTAVQYTNQVVRFTAPRIQRGDRFMSAAGLTADFQAQQLYLTNGQSTMEPMVVARAIGPHVARALAPFHFLEPPAVQGYGVIPMLGERGADLWFNVQSGRFEWLDFSVPRVAGQVHWTGLSLLLTNMSLDFYGGSATGAAAFDFDPAHKGTDFQFALEASEARLQALMAGAFKRTNHLAGSLDGTLVITHGNSEDWRATAGQGALRLRDGLIWEIPLFGVFSPVLNRLLPGLGSARANAGACSFVISNGVLHSDDLEIRAGAMRLRYRGATDLHGRLDAKVEAELLRDLPLFGPLVSTVFWPVTKLFEYKVTGSLDEPKAEPLYLLPRVVLMPLHPVSALKGLFPEILPLTHTNTPPPPRR